MTKQQIEQRQKWGEFIARRFNIVQEGPEWLVPSSRRGTTKVYRVCADPVAYYCNCLDHLEHNEPCKHIYAAREKIRQLQGEPPPSDADIEKPPPKPKYPMNWRAFNQAQTSELHEFQYLLHDLCQNVAEPAQGRGRPRTPRRDCIYAAASKVYANESTRRSVGHVDLAYERGYISRPMCFSKITGTIENPALTPIIKSLISLSSRPLAAVEEGIAFDSTGFTTANYVRYHQDIRYPERTDKDENSERIKKDRGVTEHDWVKVHIGCGVKTHVITGVIIKDRDASDLKQLPALLGLTLMSKDSVKEVMCDAIYNSVANQELVASIGATAYIPFNGRLTGAAGGVFQRAYFYYQYHREDFLKHYHQRSNVETVFKMINSKFGKYVRCRTETARVNEVLLKLLCHNICVLIQSMYELGITPEFIPADVKSASRKDAAD